MIRYLVILIIFFSFIPNVKARAEEAKQVSCANIQAKIYDSPWDNFKADAKSEPELILVKTIDAMQAKDKTLLKKLSHPADESAFERQASAYLAQLEIIKPVQVKAYYTFENLGVFFIQFQFNEKTEIVDFPFITGKNNNLEFLMDRLPFVNGPIYGPLNNWYHWDKKETPYICQATPVSP